MGALSAITLSGLGHLLLAAEPITSAPSVWAPYVQGGGSAAAVAGLVYVARMVIRGDLVPRPVNDLQREQAALTVASYEREAKLQELLERERTEREEADRLLTDTRKALWAAESTMRYWQEKAERRGPGGGLGV